MKQYVNPKPRGFITSLSFIRAQSEFLPVNKADSGSKFSSGYDRKQHNKLVNELANMIIEASRQPAEKDNRPDNKKEYLLSGNGNNLYIRYANILESKLGFSGYKKETMVELLRQFTSRVLLCGYAKKYSLQLELPLAS